MARYEWVIGRWLPQPRAPRPVVCPQPAVADRLALVCLLSTAREWADRRPDRRP